MRVFVVFVVCVMVVIWGGRLCVFIIIMIECGVLVGFFVKEMIRV